MQNFIKFITFLREIDAISLVRDNKATIQVDTLNRDRNILRLSY